MICIFFFLALRMGPGIKVITKFVIMRKLLTPCSGEPAQGYSNYPLSRRSKHALAFLVLRSDGKIFFKKKKKIDFPTTILFVL